MYFNTSKCNFSKTLHAKISLATCTYKTITAASPPPFPCCRHFLDNFKKVMALKSKIEVPMYWFMYMLQAYVSFDKRLLVTFRYLHETIYEMK